MKKGDKVKIELPDSQLDGAVCRIVSTKAKFMGLPALRVEILSGQKRGERLVMHFDCPYALHMKSA